MFMRRRFVINDDMFIFDQSAQLSFEKICDYIINELNKPLSKTIYSGYIDKSVVLIDINSQNCDNYGVNMINQQLNPKKIYLLPKSCNLYRRCKVAIPGDFYEEIIGLDGSEKNFSNWGNRGQMRIIIPNLQDKIENDPITGQKYGPSINRTWTFEEPISHAEWAIRDSFSAI